MKTKIFPIAILLNGITFFSMAAGQPGELNKTIHPGTFHSLKVSGDIHVIVSNNGDQSVSMPGNDNDDVINCTVEDGELVIRQRGKSKEQINVVVSTSVLHRLEATDHASVTVDEPTDGDELTVVVKDQGEVRLKSNASEINAYAFQQGIIRVAGDYACSSTYLKNYDVLVAKYIKNDGAERESVLTTR